MHKKKNYTLMIILLVMSFVVIERTRSSYLVRKESARLKSAYDPSTVSINSPEIVASRRRLTTTVGATKEEVLEIQGKPTKTVGDVWYYKDSNIVFSPTGETQSYYDKSNVLKILPAEDGQGIDNIGDQFWLRKALKAEEEKNNGSL